MTVAGALAVLCLGAGRRDSVAADRVLRWWARWCLRAFGARVSVSGPGLAGLAGPGSGGPVVVVANHQSGLDPVTLIRALPLSLRILAMRELFAHPVLGRALRTIGMIEVDRDSPSLRVIVKSVAERLAAGHSVLVFPEGKISVDGSVREFKDGAFLMAVMNQVPVLPVAICGTNRVWPAVGRAIRGGSVQIVVGSPIATAGLTRREVPALREQAREFTLGAHGEWLAGARADWRTGSGVQREGDPVE